MLSKVHKSAADCRQRGDIHYGRGELSMALECYDQAVELEPSGVAAWCNRGVALHELGRYAEALASHHQALSLNPQDPTSWLNCGNTLQAMGARHAALSSYAQALRLDPQDALVHHARGNLLMELGECAAALQHFDVAVLLWPNGIECHLSRGVALMELDRPEEALGCFDEACRLAPNLTSAHFNRGCALNRLHRPQEALICFEAAQALGDQSAELQLNRGYSLTELDLWAQAAAAFEYAVKASPQMAPAWSNLGLALDRTKRFADSSRCHEQALAIQPDYAIGRYNRSFLELRMGRYREGFALYESRWSTQSFRDRIRHPQLSDWQGEALPPGSAVVVFAEQGFGDTIQFVRFVPELRRRGVEVVLQVPDRLVNLLAQQWPDVLVLNDSDPLPMHVVSKCPLMSLPYRLETRLENLPSPEGYLQADPILLQQWEKRLNAALGTEWPPTVGLMWRGGSATRYRNRSLSWQTLQPILQEGYVYISLQKDLPSDEALTLASDPRVHHFGAEQRSFADAAALAQLCDLVITVDTSVAHLSGALGRPTWLMLPYDADWRWLENRSDSPWYSSVTIYRQSVEAAWEPVVGAVAEELRKRVRNRTEVLT
jgi:tetratricopeptide (TPR) repeat protein